MHRDGEAGPQPRRRRPPEDPSARRQTPDAHERRRRAYDMDDRRTAREPGYREPGRAGADAPPVERELPAMAAAAAGVQQIAQLTGRETEGIVSLEPASDGWVVSVEVVEDRRIPSSTDVLAIYEAKLDAHGDLTAYARKRRYARGKHDAGEGA